MTTALSRVVVVGVKEAAGVEDRRVEPRRPQGIALFDSCGSDTSGGYCDCCPDCYSCVHGDQPPAATELEQEPAASLVENTFCDCRAGLDVAPDYAPCWNSCLDCLGDDGSVAYMPDDVAAACIDAEECFLYGVQEGASGTWYSCTSGDVSSCTASSAATATLPDYSKLKAAALCG